MTRSPIETDTCPNCGKLRLVCGRCGTKLEKKRSENIKKGRAEYYECPNDDCWTDEIREVGNPKIPTDQV